MIFRAFVIHNDKTDIIIIKDYEIFSGRSNDCILNSNVNNHHNQTGGVAIAIHNKLTNNIQTIIMTNGRIMEIRLKVD